MVKVTADSYGRSGLANAFRSSAIDFRSDRVADALSPRDSTDDFLRTLLFSTSKRGLVIESMHVALARNETHQNFNIWVLRR